MAIELSSFELLNYRSCSKTLFRPNKNLSTLIGLNGSGKSNILQGILLLKKIARSHRRSDEDFLSNEARITVEFSFHGKPVKYRAKVKFTTNKANRDEIVRVKERWNFYGITGKSLWERIPHNQAWSHFPNISFPGRNLPLDLSHTRAFLDTSGQFVLSGGKLTKPSKEIQDELKLQMRKRDIVQKIRNYWLEISYYSASQFTNPSECPSSFEVSEEDRMRHSSTRHRSEQARFMYDLYNAYSTERPRFEEFLSIVGNKGLRLIDTIKYKSIPVPANEVEVRTGGKVIKKKFQRKLIVPHFIINNASLSPNQLSEGTFKTLALVFYLIIDNSGLLLLEEPEVCIHHGLLAGVVDLIKSFSQRKQIVVTTHSDFVLDHIKPENVFFVKSSKRGTVVKSVSQELSKEGYRALHDYLKNTGNLGEYWRHGALDNE